MEPAIAEAYRQGTGPGWEATMIVQPWDFSLTEVTGPVTVWHGAADHVVPVAAGRLISDLVPAAKLVEIPESGHFVLFEQWSNVLDRLLQA